MEIQLSQEICKKVPNFKIGFIQYEGVQIGPSPQMLKGRLQLFQESIFFDLQEKPLSDYVGIQEWRAIFKATGKDPNRYRHSAEALYRRIAKQNYLQSIHSATDLNNFFSLQYEVPIGIYDTNKLEGNIMMKIGEETDEYIGLNGRTNSLKGLIHTNDDKGPFGSPYVDSTRTAVTEETTNAIQIIYLRPSIDKENAEKLTHSLMNMFVQIHGGSASYHVIGC